MINFLTYFSMIMGTVLMLVGTFKLNDYCERKYGYSGTTGILIMGAWFSFIFAVLFTISDII